MVKKYYIQDAEVIPQKIFKLFSDDLEHNDFKIKDGIVYSNFVGVIFGHDRQLVSFPKHYYTVYDLKNYIKNNSKILEEDSLTLLKLITKVKNTKQSIGIIEDIDNSFPFSSYLKVYEYFQKYGIYHEEKKLSSKIFSGKINWKQTINKVIPIYDENNFLYLEFYKNRTINNQVFLSKCLGYIINSTNHQLNNILNFKYVDIDYSDIDWSNKNKVLTQLNKELESTFKDIHKTLIRHMINFFKHKNVGVGIIPIKLNNFSIMWEIILENYLCNYFIGNKADRLLFSEENLIRPKAVKKKQFEPGFHAANDSLDDKKNYRIEPDYYFIDEDVRYIFDAKYYHQITEINYKQLSYYFLLRDIEDEIKKTYSVLLLPTSSNIGVNENYKIHFKFNDNFNKVDREFTIFEYYLNIKEMINIFVLKKRINKLDKY